MGILFLNSASSNIVIRELFILIGIKYNKNISSWLKLIILHLAIFHSWSHLLPSWGQVWELGGKGTSGDTGRNLLSVCRSVQMCVCIRLNSYMTSSLDWPFHSVHAMTADGKVVLIIITRCSWGFRFEADRFFRFQYFSSIQLCTDGLMKLLINILCMQCV